MLVTAKQAERYASQLSEMQAALVNLNEFICTMPEAKEGDHGIEIPGVDPGFFRSVDELHGEISTASDIADEVFE